MKTLLLLSGLLVAVWMMAPVAGAVPGENCQNPIIIPSVTHYENVANTCDAQNTVPYIGTCGGGNPSGPDIIYRFTLASPATVSLRDSFGTWDYSPDLQLMVFTNCADPMGSCVVSVDVWPYEGFQEEVRDLHLAPGTYYVANSARGNSCGSVYFEIFSDVLLPVELLSFEGEPGDNSARLSWSTASETDNDHFEIERDGHTVASIPSAGNATGSSYAWTDGTVRNGTVYHYALVAISTSGDRRVLSEVAVAPASGAATATEYALHQNYPNPFNPTTSIALDLVDNGFTTLKVYNLMGQEVASLIAGNLEKGRHVVSFNAANLSSGVYLYRLNVNGFVAEKKMLLMK